MNISPKLNQQIHIQVTRWPQKIRLYLLKSSRRLIQIPPCLSKTPRSYKLDQWPFQGLIEWFNMVQYWTIDWLWLILRLAECLNEWTHERQGHEWHVYKGLNKWLNQRINDCTILYRVPEGLRDWIEFMKWPQSMFESQHAEHREQCGNNITMCSHFWWTRGKAAVPLFLGRTLRWRGSWSAAGFRGHLRQPTQPTPGTQWTFRSPMARESWQLHTVPENRFLEPPAANSLDHCSQKICVS